MMLKEILIMEDGEFKQKKGIIHHDATGEPVFRRVDGLSRGFLEWHPFQKEAHPSLERSFEFGDHQIPTENKDWSHFYKRAGRANFNDELPTTISDDLTTLTVHHPVTDKPISRITVPHDGHPGNLKWRTQTPLISTFREHYDAMKKVYPTLIHDDNNPGGKE